MKQDIADLQSLLASKAKIKGVIVAELQNVIKSMHSQGRQKLDMRMTLLQKNQRKRFRIMRSIFLLQRMDILKDYAFVASGWVENKS